MLRHATYKRNEKDFATKVVEDDSTGLVTLYVDDKAAVTSEIDPSSGIVDIIVSGNTVYPSGFVTVPANGTESDATTRFQQAANVAKAGNLGLRIKKGVGPYKINNVDVAGLNVFADFGATFEAPAGATGYCFTAMGLESERVTTPTKLSNVVHSGGGTQLGLFKARYCDDVVVDSCSGVSYQITVAEGISLTECLRPKVVNSKISSGRMGVVFISCTSPLALGVSTTGQGRDGISFYTDHAGTLTTDAIAIGCTATSFCLNGEAGRAGIHFYGVRRASATGCISLDDSEQTNDDTAGIRFRDCEDFSASGYTVSGCRVGVLVNSAGDYSEFSIVSRGAIGAGSVYNSGKYGVAVASATTICTINGVNVSTIANAAGGAGIFHSGNGAIDGCSVSDSPVDGIYASGVNSIVGNALIRSGTGSTSIPGVNVGGKAVVSGNAFMDDRGTPLSTIAIRILSGGSAMIGQQFYGTGITDFVVASAGSTVKRGSGPIQQKFAGAPTSLSGTIENGVTGVDTNGVTYVYRGAWRRVDPKTLTATIGTTQTTVAHGLGYAPTSVSIVPGVDARVWQSAVADATNVYLTASVSASCMINVQ